MTKRTFSIQAHKDVASSYATQCPVLFSNHPNTQNYMAQLKQGQIEGFVSSLVSAEAENMNAEREKMLQFLQKELKISLNGAVTESYAIYKENPYKTIHYKTYNGKCIAAANSALEKSLQDSSISIEMAAKIREFVKTDFC